MVFFQTSEAGRVFEFPDITLAIHPAPSPLIVRELVRVNIEAYHHPPGTVRG